MKLSLSAFATAALCLAPTLSAQSGVVDVSVTADNVFYNMGFFNDLQQNVRVETAGQLEGFSIRMATQDINVGLPVAIYNGLSPHTGPPLWSGTAFASAQGVTEWVFVDCSSANLQYNVNDVFVIQVGDFLNFTPGVDLILNSGWPNPFYIEDFHEAGNPQNLTRLTFETYMLVDPPVLTVTGAAGGFVTFDVAGGNGNFWLVYGQAGSSTVRGVDLDMVNPALGATMGTSLNVNVPAGAAGLTVQAIDMQWMLASNPVVLQ